MKILTVVLVGMLWFAGAAWSGDFTVNPNGTVTDNVTGLMWQQEDDNTTRTWEQALAYCENLTLDTQADWRLPNMKELESITDVSRVNPTIDPLVFPDTNGSIYWTSTTNADNTIGVWFVDFSNGYVEIINKTFSYYARCVRGGQ